MSSLNSDFIDTISNKMCINHQFILSPLLAWASNHIFFSLEYKWQICLGLFQIASKFITWFSKPSHSGRIHLWFNWVRSIFTHFQRYLRCSLLVLNCICAKSEQLLWIFHSTYLDYVAVKSSICLFNFFLFNSRKLV